MSVQYIPLQLFGVACYNTVSQSVSQSVTVQSVSQSVNTIQSVSHTVSLVQLLESVVSVITGRSGQSVSQLGVGRWRTGVGRWFVLLAGPGATISRGVAGVNGNHNLLLFIIILMICCRRASSHGRRRARAARSASGDHHTITAWRFWRNNHSVSVIRAGGRAQSGGQSGYMAFGSAFNANNHLLL